MSEITQGEWRVTAMSDSDQLLIETDDYVIAECNEVVERDITNFRAIVHRVNNHQRLAEALRAAMRFIDCHVADPDLSHEMIEAYSELNRINPHKLLAQLEAGKGGGK